LRCRCQCRDRCAGFADGHDDAAPVGVLSGDGGFDEGGIGDGKGHGFGGGVGGGAGHGDFDEFCRALAVADDLVGEIAEDVLEGGGEIGIGADIWAFAGCSGEQRVGGGGVAVDRDGVEGPVAAVFQEGLERLAGQGGVGEDIGEHRGHVRGDHARAFGDACDGDGLASDGDLARGAFGVGVGS